MTQSIIFDSSAMVSDMSDGIYPNHAQGFTLVKFGMSRGI